MHGAVGELRTIQWNNCDVYATRRMIGAGRTLEFGWSKNLCDGRHRQQFNKSATEIPSRNPIKIGRIRMEMTVAVAISYSFCSDKCAFWNSFIYSELFAQRHAK